MIGSFEDSDWVGQICLLPNLIDLKINDWNIENYISTENFKRLLNLQKLTKFEMGYDYPLLRFKYRSKGSINSIMLI